jgi:hypothetical protein
MSGSRVMAARLIDASLCSIIKVPCRRSRSSNRSTAKNTNENPAREVHVDVACKDTHTVAPDVFNWLFSLQVDSSRNEIKSTESIFTHAMFDRPQVTCVGT